MTQYKIDRWIEDRDDNRIADRYDLERDFCSIDNEISCLDLDDYELSNIEGTK